MKEISMMELLREAFLDAYHRLQASHQACMRFRGNINSWEYRKMLQRWNSHFRVALKMAVTTVQVASVIEIGCTEQKKLEKAIRKFNYFSTGNRKQKVAA